MKVEVQSVSEETIREQEDCIQTFYAVLSDLEHLDEPFSAKQVLDTATAAIRESRQSCAVA